MGIGVDFIYSTGFIRFEAMKRLCEALKKKKYQFEDEIILFRKYDFVLEKKRGGYILKEFVFEKMPDVIWDFFKNILPYTSGYMTYYGD